MRVGVSVEPHPDTRPLIRRLRRHLLPLAGEKDAKRKNTKAAPKGAAFSFDGVYRAVTMLGRSSNRTVSPFFALDLRFWHSLPRRTRHSPNSQRKLLQDGPAGALKRRIPPRK